MAIAGKKKGLGKGLEALIPHWQDVEHDAQSGNREQIRLIEIHSFPSRRSSDHRKSVV